MTEYDDNTNREFIPAPVPQDVVAAYTEIIEDAELRRALDEGKKVRFRVYPGGDEWDYSGEVPVRIIRNAKILSVSLDRQG